MERNRSVGWEIASWALVVVAAGYGLMALGELSVAEATYRAVTGGSLSGLEVLVPVSRLTDSLFVAGLVAMEVALLVWRGMSVHLLRRNGIDDVPQMVRHWTIRVWSIVFTLSVLITFYTLAPWDHTREGLLRTLRYAELRFALRVVAVAFLVVGVVLVSRRLRRFFADPTKPLWAAPEEPPAPPELTDEENQARWERFATDAGWAEEPHDRT
jgi:hypothetical protein